MLGSSIFVFLLALFEVRNFHFRLVIQLKCDETESWGVLKAREAWGEN